MRFNYATTAFLRKRGKRVEVRPSDGQISKLYRSGIMSIIIFDYNNTQNMNRNNR